MLVDETVVVAGGADTVMAAVVEFAVAVPSEIVTVVPSVTLDAVGWNESWRIAACAVAGVMPLRV
jgi:predicted kinase